MAHWSAFRRRLDAPAPLADRRRGEQARLGEGVVLRKGPGLSLGRDVDDEERADHAVLVIEERPGREQDRVLLLEIIEMRRPRGRAQIEDVRLVLSLDDVVHSFPSDWARIGTQPGDEMVELHRSAGIALVEKSDDIRS